MPSLCHQDRDGGERFLGRSGLPFDKPFCPGGKKLGDSHGAGFANAGSLSESSPGGCGCGCGMVVGGVVGWC